MGHYYTINGGLKHTFAKDRMTMSIYVNDIFNSGTVRVTGTDPSVTHVSVMQLPQARNLIALQLQGR